MRTGITLPTFGPAVGDARTVSGFAAAMEQSGFDTLWGAERLFVPVEKSSPYPGGEGRYATYAEVIPRAMDPFSLTAVAIAATERIRFNFSTLNAPVHQPIHLARSLTTLDVLSGGRLDAGFALGWLRDEYDALGVPWSQRGRVLDDLLSFLHVWWTADPVAYESPYISLPPVLPGLRPVQPGGPPIYLGGTSVAALARVGRRAAGWLGVDVLPEDYLGVLWDTARRAAEDAGRDPGALEMVVRINSGPGESLGSLAGRFARAADNGAAEAFVDFTFAIPELAERIAVAEQLMARRTW